MCLWITGRSLSKTLRNLPVWINVCFFMSDFWWNLFPQYWHGYGRVSEWIRRWVDKVEDLLKLLPHILQSKLLSCYVMQIKALRKCCYGMSTTGNSLRSLIVIITSMSQDKILPVSEQPCVVLGWPRAQMFFHRSHKQRVWSHCEISSRGPPAHEAWRTPDGITKNQSYILVYMSQFN